MMLNFILILTALRDINALVGVIVICIGTAYAAYQTVLFWLQRQPLSLDIIRRDLGKSILLGLDFILSGDVIETIVTPDYYQIGILAILVIIRTILSYFLGKEILATHD